MESLQGQKSRLPPVLNGNTEILILGSRPSDKSLAAEQYYANPGNDFLRQVGAALDENIDGLSYVDKLERRQAAHNWGGDLASSASYALVITRPSNFTRDAGIPASIVSRLEIGSLVAITT